MSELRARSLGRPAATDCRVTAHVVGSADGDRAHLPAGRRGRGRGGLRDRLGGVRAGRGAGPAPARRHAHPPARRRRRAATTSARCGSSRRCAATGWPRSTGCSTGSPRSWTGSAPSATTCGPASSPRPTPRAASERRDRRARSPSRGRRDRASAAPGPARRPSTSPTTTTSGAGRCTATTPLFERLSLEAFQSGLSWLIILRKRPAFRAAFAGFDPAAVAAFGAGRRRAAARRRRHRPQPRQDRGDDPQRRPGARARPAAGRAAVVVRPGDARAPGHARRRARRPRPSRRPWPRS